MQGFEDVANCLGAIYLISMYYKRHEVQIRITFFFSGSIIAGALSGVRIVLRNECFQETYIQNSYSLSVLPICKESEAMVPGDGSSSSRDL